MNEKKKTKMYICDNNITATRGHREFEKFSTNRWRCKVPYKEKVHKTTLASNSFDFVVFTDLEVIDMWSHFLGTYKFTLFSKREKVNKPQGEECGKSTCCLFLFFLSVEWNILKWSKFLFKCIFNFSFLR